MRYRVRISEMRYGEAIVESKNEEEAKEVAYLNGIDWFDHEITDMTVEPEPENNRTFMVVEVCPHCMSEIEMRWNTDTQGFKAFCPVCGKRLMLCDECLHTRKGDCDYDSTVDGCKFSMPGEVADMESLQDRDKNLEDLWERFGELPLNPETECIETSFLHFPAGTFREDIWHWFDERYSRGVYYLLYGSECGVDGMSAETLRLAYEKQQHIYDIQDMKYELESDDYIEKYDIDSDPVTDEELELMAVSLRSRLDKDADASWSVCRTEAAEEILNRRKYRCG